LIGTAHAQAARVVVAAGIGHGAAHRARRHVRDHDFGAGHRLPAAVGDDAADARRRALGDDGRRGERGDPAARQLRAPQAVATGPVGSLDGWSWDTGWTGGTCGRWCAMGMRPRRATWPWVNIRLTRYRLQMTRKRHWPANGSHRQRWKVPSERDSSGKSLSPGRHIQAAMLWAM